MSDFEKLNRDDINRLFKLRETDKADVGAKLDSILLKLESTARETRNHVDQKLDAQGARLGALERKIGPGTTARQKKYGNITEYEPQALSRASHWTVLAQNPLVAVMVLGIVALLLVAMVLAFKSPVDTERLLKAIQELRHSP